jgi:hypothetical protein
MPLGRHSTSGRLLAAAGPRNRGIAELDYLTLDRDNARSGRAIRRQFRREAPSSRRKRFSAEENAEM